MTAAKTPFWTICTTAVKFQLSKSGKVFGPAPTIEPEKKNSQDVQDYNQSMYSMIIKPQKFIKATQHILVHDHAYRQTRKFIQQKINPIPTSKGKRRPN